MKFLTASRVGLFLGLAVLLTGGLRAQDADTQLTPAQVDQLMGPIALYPDALVALILPASTSPSDVVLAARYVTAGGDPDQIDNQPWNDSVKALARYPSLIKWMDDNLQWTQQLGSAFLNQPDELMNSVQRLRKQARAAGTLTSTPQQKVELDGDIIEIVPAQPDVIYVPYYDPAVVYVEQPPYYYGQPYVTFGLGLPIGFWLSYDFNWRRHAIWVGDRQHNWRDRRDWDRHGSSNSAWHPWKPPVTRPPFSRPDPRRPHPDIRHPNPFPGSPNFPPHDNRPRRENAGRDNNRPSPQPASNPPNVNRPPTRPDTHDSRDRHDDHSNDHRPPTPPAPPRPDQTSPFNNPPRPMPNQQQPPPQPKTADTPHAKPIPTRDLQPMPTPRPPPTRPDARPDRPEPRVEPRQHDAPAPRPNNPPPPPKDDPRDKDSKDVQR